MTSHDEHQYSVIRDIQNAIIEKRNKLKNFNDKDNVDAEKAYGNIKEMLKEYMIQGKEDRVYGVYHDGKEWKMGTKNVKFICNKIKVGNKKYRGTRGLLELLFVKNPNLSLIQTDDLDTYKKILVHTGAHLNKHGYLKTNPGFKYKNVISNLFSKNDYFKHSEEDYDDNIESEEIDSSDTCSEDDTETEDENKESESEDENDKDEEERSEEDDEKSEEECVGSEEDEGSEEVESEEGDEGSDEDEGSEDADSSDASSEDEDKINEPLKSYVDGYEHDFDYGLYPDGHGNWKIGSHNVTFEENDICTEDRCYKGSPGLYQLLFKQWPVTYSKKDLKLYKLILEETEAHLNSDGSVKRNLSPKYFRIIKKLFPEVEYSSNEPPSKRMRYSESDSDEENNENNNSEKILYHSDGRPFPSMLQLDAPKLFSRNYYDF